MTYARTSTRIKKCGINIEACTKWTCTDQVEHKWIKLSNHGVTGQPVSHRWIELGLLTHDVVSAALGQNNVWFRPSFCQCLQKEKEFLSDKYQISYKFLSDKSDKSKLMYLIFEFLHAIQLVIPNNRELKQENDKRLKQLEEKNLSDATKMVKEHLDRIAQHNYVPINDKRYGCKMCESLPTYYDDFKAIRKD